jgi:hypothetical protein
MSRTLEAFLGYQSAIGLFFISLLIYFIFALTSWNFDLSQKLYPSMLYDLYIAYILPFILYGFLCDGLSTETDARASREKNEVVVSGIEILKGIGTEILVISTSALCAYFFGSFLDMLFNGAKRTCRRLNRKSARD